jgi:hypothetical protein
MKEEDILLRITPIFRFVFNDPEMLVSERLSSDDIPDWSSISLAILVTELEKEFGITFKLREVAMMDGVASIINLIHKKIDNTE